MVYDSLKLLQMCSPDHFESRTINKEGNVVELEVHLPKRYQEITNSIGKDILLKRFINP